MVPRRLPPPRDQRLIQESNHESSYAAWTTQANITQTATETRCWRGKRMRTDLRASWWQDRGTRMSGVVRAGAATCLLAVGGCGGGVKDCMDGNTLDALEEVLEAGSRTISN